MNATSTLSFTLQLACQLQVVLLLCRIVYLERVHDYIMGTKALYCHSGSHWLTEGKCGACESTRLGPLQTWLAEASPNDISIPKNDHKR